MHSVLNVIWIFTAFVAIDFSQGGVLSRTACFGIETVIGKNMKKSAYTNCMIIDK